MARISQRRQQILRFIREFIDRKGYPPTVRDILHSCNISSPAVVQHHLKVLENQGHISREPGIRRSITLADREARGSKVPILGVHRRRPAHPRARSQMPGTRSPWRCWNFRLTWLPP